MTDLIKKIKDEGRHTACVLTIQTFEKEMILTQYIDYSGDIEQQMEEIAEYTIMQVIKFFAENEYFISSDGKQTIGIRER